jgi:hypothetical protein
MGPLIGNDVDYSRRPARSRSHHVDGDHFFHRQQTLHVEVTDCVGGCNHRTHCRRDSGIGIEDCQCTRAVGYRPVHPNELAAGGRH